MCCRLSSSTRCLMATCADAPGAASSSRRSCRNAGSAALRAPSSASDDLGFRDLAILFLPRRMAAAHDFTRQRAIDEHHLAFTARDAPPSVIQRLDFQRGRGKVRFSGFGARHEAGARRPAYLAQAARYSPRCGSVAPAASRAPARLRCRARLRSWCRASSGNAVQQVGIDHVGFAVVADPGNVAVVICLPDRAAVHAELAGKTASWPARPAARCCAAGTWPARPSDRYGGCGNG